MRKTSELTLRVKELELEDRQYEIDKRLCALSDFPGVCMWVCVCACECVCVHVGVCVCMHRM